MLEKDDFVREERRFNLQTRKLRVDLGDNVANRLIIHDHALFSPPSSSSSASAGGLGADAETSDFSTKPAPEKLHWSLLHLSSNVPLQAWCKEVLDKLNKHPDGAPFTVPVDTHIYTDYREYVFFLCRSKKEN